jgi:hypothetical protein
MAQQMAKMFKIAIMVQQASDGSTPTIAQIEADMRETLRQAGNQTLSLFLSSMQTTPEKENTCSCGGISHYQRMRELFDTSENTVRSETERMVGLQKKREETLIQNRRSI